jgi:hypothetical protein
MIPALTCSVPINSRASKAHYRSRDRCFHGCCLNSVQLTLWHNSDPGAVVTMSPLAKAKGENFILARRRLDTIPQNASLSLAHNVREQSPSSMKQYSSRPRDTVRVPFATSRYGRLDFVYSVYTRYTSHVGFLQYERQQYFFFFRFSDCHPPAGSSFQESASTLACYYGIKCFTLFIHAVEELSTQSRWETVPKMRADRYHIVGKSVRRALLRDCRKVIESSLSLQP